MKSNNGKILRDRSNIKNVTGIIQRVVPARVELMNSSNEMQTVNLQKAEKLHVRSHNVKH